MGIGTVFIGQSNLRVKGLLFSAPQGRILLSLTGRW